MDNNVFVVYDRNVERFALDLSQGRPCFPLTADEAHKTIDTVMDICRWLLSEGADRNAVIWAVGGGCTTDMTGFAAGIYKRGIRYINHPTTLLAMVDAAWGGKTGVNLDGYKNMVGVFKLPLRTVIDTEYLRTLPAREFRSGAAEMLKTFIIGDKDCYAKAVKVLSAPEPDLEALRPLILEAARIKLDIVDKDPFEENIRRHLNLGHTLGHAIEWWQSQAPGRTQYSHGEAVAIGTVYAARLSEKHGLCAKGLAARICEDFRACGLPTELPCPESGLTQAVRNDKKAIDGKINFVTINKIGKVSVTPLPVPED